MKHFIRIIACLFFHHNWSKITPNHNRVCLSCHAERGLK